MKHLRDPLLDSSWNYTLRSDSTAANAVDQPSLASGAGSDRPSPVASSLAGDPLTGEGLFRRGRDSGSLMAFPPPAPAKLSRRLRLETSFTSLDCPPEPTGILSLVPAVRGELGGSSEFERSPSEGAGNPFGEVRSFPFSRGTVR